MVRLIEAIRTEMINSQSARLASTLISHDALRFDTLVDKMEAFINDYVEDATPLDLPESSPGEEAIGHGRGGV